MNTLKDFVVTFGFLGKAPVAPGTFGTLGGVALAWLLRGVAPFLTTVLVVAALLYAAGRSLAPWAEERLGKDPGSFVIDEVVGYLIAVAWIRPPSLLTLGLGFAFFRLFDILKPWPVKRLEHLPGGDGIMMDDVAAGLMALGVLAVLRFLFPGQEADIWSWTPSEG